MIHCLFEPLEAFLQHLPIDVDDLHRRFSVVMLLSGVVENSERNVARSSGNINTLQRAFPSRPQSRHEIIFPETLDTKRARVIHEVV